ncbi:ankyrin repeat-containing domain protein, partial [Morchella snyderi]
EIIEALLSAGTDVNEKAGGGRTALTIAIENQDDDIVKALLDHGADPNAARCSGGNTPLHLTVRQGHLLHTTALLSLGADIAARNGKGYTALHVAMKDGNILVFNALRGARADVNAADDNGNTALHHASWHGNSHVVAILLSQGERERVFWKSSVDVNARNRKGVTALHFAIEKQNLSVARMLLWHDQIDLNLRSLDRGFTPL